MFFYTLLNSYKTAKNKAIYIIKIHKGNKSILMIFIPLINKFKIQILILVINVNLKRIALGTGVFVLIGIIIVSAVKLRKEKNEKDNPGGYMVERVKIYERECF